MYLNKTISFLNEFTAFVTEVFQFLLILSSGTILQYVFRYFFCYYQKKNFNTQKNSASAMFKVKIFIFSIKLMMYS